MKRNRLEAFSDGVLAIVITIMVLEMEAPEGVGLEDLRSTLPVFLAYALSFVYLGIYWNNHHHLLHAAGRVTAGILWSNLHLLFWLSLIPFTTAWLGQHPAAAWPQILYGAILLLSAAAYFLLQYAIVASEGCDSDLARNLGRDRKGKLSLLLYTAGISLAATLPGPWAIGCYLAVALMWLIPDRRVERAVSERAGDGSAT